MKVTLEGSSALFGVRYLMTALTFLHFIFYFVFINVIMDGSEMSCEIECFVCRTLSVKTCG